MKQSTLNTIKRIIKEELYYKESAKELFNKLKKGERLELMMPNNIPTEVKFKQDSLLDTIIGLEFYKKGQNRPFRSIRMEEDEILDYLEQFRDTEYNRKMFSIMQKKIKADSSLL